jgi:hypothetical protein
MITERSRSKCPVPISPRNTNRELSILDPLSLSLAGVNSKLPPISLHSNEIPRTLSDKTTPSTMNSSAKLLSLVLAAFASNISAVSWDLDTSSAVCDGNPFANDDVEVECGGSSSCELGDTAHITGTIEAVSGGFGDGKVTLQPCVVTYCPEKWAAEAGDACDWLEPTDGQDCGEAGSYNVDYEVAIPASVPTKYAWFSSLIKVKVLVESVEECEAEDDPAANMAYAAMGVVGLVAFGAAALRKRKQSSDTQEEETKDYVEMGVNKNIVIV